MLFRGYPNDTKKQIQSKNIQIRVKMFKDLIYLSENTTTGLLACAQSVCLVLETVKQNVHLKEDGECNFKNNNFLPGLEFTTTLADCWFFRLDCWISMLTRKNRSWIVGLCLKDLSYINILTPIVYFHPFPYSCYSSTSYKPILLFI